MLKTGTRALALATAGVLTLGLSACGKDATEDGAPATAESTATPSSQEKFNHYVEGYNKLVDDSWGVRSNFNDYQELDVAHASPGDSISFPENITTLEGAIAALKAGQAIRSDDPSRRVDEAAQALIPRLDALLAQWKTLDPYYETRRYREDNLAQGKAADAPLIAAYQTAIAGIERFNDALTGYLRARDAAQLAAYRASGQGDLANLMAAMQKADLFTDAVIKGDKALADQQLPALETAVVALRKSQVALPADNANKSGFDRIAGYLEGMIGDYRDFKQSGSDSDREYVVDKYNDAVGVMDDIEHPAR